jgi:hypothetical protein
LISAIEAKNDAPLSNFAFEFIMRCYVKASAAKGDDEAVAALKLMNESAY